MKFLPIIAENPPNFAAIDAAFGVAGKAIIFAYGGAIYNPRKVAVTVELQAHEAVHCDRQAGNPDGWWRQYIDDVAFRCDEEVHAHRAEWALYRKRHANPRKRSEYLNAIANRLSGPLYGARLNWQQARDLIERTT